MDIFKPTINDFGGSPFCEHNMPCFCLKNKAVYNLSEGTFGLCWECRKIFKIRKINFLDSMFQWMGFKSYRDL